MTAPAIFLTWWFPFVSVLAAVLLILLLWRRELAPLFTREHLLPTWRFWDQILPQFIFARRRELHARRRIHTLVEWGREIRDKTTWDPAEERAEWFRSAYETIQESYPLKAPGFFAVHGDRWNTKGHREILNDEIQWLINILNS